MSSPDANSQTTDEQPHRPPAPKAAPKQRLDLLLAERGLTISREQARRLIMAGEVTVNDKVVDKPGQLVAVTATLAVRQPPPFVSRGGLKLAAALDAFNIDVRGRIAIDVGASTGGFSDCLLQRGVGQIFAVDVGYGQLAWKVRSDTRVVALERTNIRYLEALPHATLCDLAVIDASFIGLSLVLPATLRLLKPQADLIALIKPQFEAGQAQVGKGGVVRDSDTHRQVTLDVVALAHRLELSVAGLMVSPAPGPAGNIEFLIWLQRPATHEIDITQALARALLAAARLKRHP